MPEHAVIPALRRGLLYDVLVDADVAEDLLRYRWYVTGGYATRTVRTGDPASVAMHRQICGLLRGDPRAIHHINENRLDNRRANLLVCANASAANQQPHPKAAAAGRAAFLAYLEREGLKLRSAV